MPNKGSAHIELRDVPADGQGIADAIVKATTEAGKLFTNPVVGSASFSKGAEESTYQRATASILNVTIQEG